jgi:glycogen debranching enzyme
MQDSISPDSNWTSFIDNAKRFLQKTQEHVLQGINPGGIYQAIWCRDAAYILRDWFLSGNVQGTMQQIYQIWSHQIEPNREKLVYGRGSPEMKFLSEVAKEHKQKEFQGALPTTIYQAGFSEVYGQNPDIDSTALMVSTSSWILARSIKGTQSVSETPTAVQQTIVASEHSSDYISALLSKLGMTDPLKVAEFVIPSMLKAVEYLSSRDIDNDGLLEQNHNEDWMDTAIRAGKIVYSQACWILALRNMALLLSHLGRDDESKRMANLAYKAIKSVDQNLWSEEDGCYLDMQETHHIGGPYRTLTQDVSLYLVAVTENAANESLVVAERKHNGQEEGQTRSTILNQDLNERSNRTLDAIKVRAWKEKWPLVTEVELKSTGPWILKPYEYHNQTFWPWTTGIEILARSRFDRVDECNILFSKLASEGHPHMHAFYEWVNPITDQPNGSFPFRTGICGIRTAIVDILEKIKRN